MEFENYWLGLIQGIWLWIIRDEGFCPHCYRICVMAPYQNWKYQRGVAKFTKAFADKNPDSRLSPDELYNLYAASECGIKYGNFGFLLNVLKDIDLKGFDRWNYDKDETIFVPKILEDQPKRTVEEKLALARERIAARKAIEASKEPRENRGGE